MKKLLLLSVILIGCEIQPIIKDAETGFLNASMRIPKLDTFKIPVPECSDFEPNQVQYTLISYANGGEYQRTVPITIENNQILATEPMEFPAGRYQVDDVSLSYNGIITHTAPYEVDDRFDFGRFVDRTLPYDLEIIAGETVNNSDQVLCYTEEIIEVIGEFEWVGEIIELQTMYFYIPETSCIQYVTLEIDAYRIVEIPIFETGLQSLPIPRNFNFFALRGYLDDNSPGSPIQSFTGTQYNADGVNDQNDILFFAENCGI